MSDRKYQVCANCVMDTTDSRIVFDSDDVCDHCNTFRNAILPVWHTDDRGKEALEQLSERIKTTSSFSDFDCIIGVSGGIDSSYLTYVAVEQMGLKPLVFHVDTGWNSQEAVNNIERLIDGLGLDLYTEVINWEEMRDLQLSYFKAGVPHVDHPQDIAIFSTLYKFAYKHDIRHILTGANYSTECIRNPMEWVYFADIVQLRDIHRQFGSIPLTTFPVSKIWWHKIYLPYVKGIKVHKPLNYISFQKQPAMIELENRFGWQSYPQKHFESHFTRFYEGYWLYERFGYDTRRVQFSSLILTGQMSRDEANELLSRPPYDEAIIQRDLEYVATKLRISIAELNGYMDAPLKTFKDYKSQYVLYQIGAKFLRGLGLEMGGKR